MNIEYRTRNDEVRSEKHNFIIRYSLFSIHYLFFFSLCLLPSYILHAQSAKIDSLKKVLLTAKEDTNKVNTLNALGREMMYSNPDTTILLTQQAAALAEKINWQKGKANAFGTAGIGYWVKGDYAMALENHFAAFKIDEALNNKTGIAKRLVNIGIVYAQQANYPKALDYYFRALKMAEELGYKELETNTLGNIGSVYVSQADYPKALDYYFRALKMDEEFGNKNGIARHLGNIGIIYYEQADYLKALDYYFRALKMDEELGNDNGIARHLGNIGNVYRKQADYAKTLDYYFIALQMDEELGDKNAEAVVLGNIGSVYLSKGEFVKAKDYFIRELEISEELMDLEGIKEANQFLSELYSQTNNHKLAFEHYKKYIIAKDSIANEENTKKQTRLEMQYEFDKKEAQATAERQKQEAVAEAEKKKQQIVLLSVVSCLLLVVVFAGFIFRALRITRKQKALIERQKKLVEEKQKEILDSIHYAKRIQTALLPTEKYIDKHLNRLKSKMQE